MPVILPFCPFVANHFPGLVKTIGTAKQIPAYYLNISVVALVLLFWPALLIAFVWKRQAAEKTDISGSDIRPFVYLVQDRKRHSPTGLYLVHSSPLLGARYAPHKIDLVTRSLWTLAVLGVIPVILAANHIGLQNATTLPLQFPRPPAYLELYGKTGTAKSPARHRHSLKPGQTN